MNADEVKELFSEVVSGAAKPQKLDPYTGHPSQDLGKWLEKFDFLATSQGWDDKVKLKRLPQYLTESAEDWYRLYVAGSDKLKTYSDVISGLKTYFTPTNYKAFLRDQLKRRVQGKEEPVANYILSKQALCIRLNPGMESEQMIESIYEGMLKSIAREVFQQKPGSLEELIEVAKNIEESEGVGKPELDGSKTKESDTGIKELLDGIKAVMMDVTRPRPYPVDANRNRPPRPALKMEPRSVSFLLPPKRNETRTRDGGPRCYNCGRVGHIARSCRFAQQNGQGPNQNYKRTNAIVQASPGIGAKKSNLIYLPVFMESVLRDALIDTGSDVSFISDQVVGQNLKVRDYNGPRIRTVSGDLIQTLGVVLVPVKYGTNDGEKVQEQEFIVTNNFEFDVLLGNDFHKTTGLFVHPRTNSVGFLDTLNDKAMYGTTQEDERDGLIVGKVSLATGKDHKKPLLVAVEREIDPPSGPKVGVWSETCYTVGTDPTNASNVVRISFGPGELLFGSNLSDQECDELLEVLVPFREAFAFEGDALGKCNLTMMAIDTGDAEPIRQKPYRKSAADREEEQRQIDALLNAGIISPSRSPWASPTVLVDKKDGKRRMCVNYIKLNKVTKKDAFPLPDCRDLLDYFQGARIFSTLDMKSGYHQIMIRPEDREKTAFITQDGLWEYYFASFGQTNGPAECQRLMYAILGSMRGDFCVGYMDDCVVYSRDFESHKDHLRQVIQAFHNAGITLNPKKCVFGVDCMSFVGYIVDTEGIKMNPERVLSVLSFPRPKHITNVKQFTGLAGYNRRFIENYGKIEEPLSRLFRKDTPYFWLDDQEKAFNLIKEKICEYPVLAQFDKTLPSELRCDASGIGLGSVLVQKHEENFHPVLYLSRKLSDTESRYSATDKEALCIIWSLEKIKKWAKAYPINVMTDHKPLTYLQSKDIDKLPDRLQRYALELRKYPLVKIIYKQGKLNLDADALSRNPVLEPEDTDDNLECLCLGAHYEKENFPDLRSKQLDDSYWAPIIEHIEKDGFYNSDKKFKYGVVNGVLFREVERNTGKNLVLCVPKSMYEAILLAYHDDPIGGHFGVTKTLGRLGERFYWPGMKNYVKAYIKSCRDCQTRKSELRKPIGTLKPIQVGLPFDMVSIDLLGPFKKSESGNRHVIVATDVFTRYVIAKAVPTSTAYEVAKFLVESVMLVHGCPYKLLSDRGKCFLSKVCEGIYDLMSTEKVYTTSYHPQCNGLTESFNKVLAMQISFYVSSDQRDWDRYVPLAVFSYNTSISAATSFTPFYLLYNRQARLPADTNFDIPNVSLEQMDYATEMAIRVNEARAIAKKALFESQKRSSRYYNAKRREVSFEVGDLVMHYTPRRIVGLSTKLLHQWRGPFKIVEKKSDLNYKIASISGRSHEEVVNVNAIKRFHEREFLAQFEGDENSNQTHVTPEAIISSVSEYNDELPRLDMFVDKPHICSELERDMPTIDLMVESAAKESFIKTLDLEPSLEQCEESAVESYGAQYAAPVLEPAANSEKEPVLDETSDLPVTSDQVPNLEPALIKPVRRSGRAVRGPDRLTYAAIVALSILSLANGSFQRVNPILWRNSDTKVVSGLTRVSAAINYESPCIVFDDDLYFKWIPYTTKLRTWCDKMFEETFVEKLELFCDTPIVARGSTSLVDRAKRFVITTAILVTTLIISVVTTVGVTSTVLIMESKNTKDMSHIKSEQERALHILNSEKDKLEKVVETVRSLAETVEDLGAMYKKLDAQIQTLFENNPDYWTFIANLATRFGIIKENLVDSGRDWKKGVFNQKLLDLFNITLPCQASCPVSLFRPRSCHVDKLRKTVLFEFDAQTVKSTSVVLRADTFKLFSKVENGSRLCTTEYNGPSSVIYDYSEDCVTPVTSSLQGNEKLVLTPSVEYCSSNSPQNTTDRFWRQTRCDDIDKITAEDQIQVKATNDFNYVYCPSYEITVFNRTLACPPFVFSLPYFNSFSVGRLKYVAEQLRLQSSFDITPSYSHRVNFHMLPSMHDFKFDSDLNQTKARLGKLTDAPAEPVTDPPAGYDFITVVAAFVIGMLFCCGAYLCYQQYMCRSRRSNRIYISNRRQKTRNELEFAELDPEEEPEEQAQSEEDLRQTRPKTRAPNKLMFTASILFLCFTLSSAAPVCPSHITFKVSYFSLCDNLKPGNSSNWCHSSFASSFVEPILRLCASGNDQLLVARSLFQQKRADITKERPIVVNGTSSNQLTKRFDEQTQPLLSESLLTHELAVRFPIIRDKINLIASEWRDRKISAQMIQLLNANEIFANCNEDNYAPRFCSIDEKANFILFQLDYKQFNPMKALSLIVWSMPVLIPFTAFISIFIAMRSAKKQNSFLRRSVRFNNATLFPEPPTRF